MEQVGGLIRVTTVTLSEPISSKCHVTITFSHLFWISPTNFIELRIPQRRTSSESENVTDKTSSERDVTDKKKESPSQAVFLFDEVVIFGYLLLACIAAAAADANA